MTNTSTVLPSREDEMPRNRGFLSRWLKKRFSLLTIFFGITVLLFWYFNAFDFEPPNSRNPSPSKPPGNPSGQVVVLPGYGSFRGTQLVFGLKKVTTFHSPVDAWLGIPYSTQPIGQDRFKPVTWPQPFDGIADAAAPGPACWQNVYGLQKQSEACLTINVYRPSGIPMEQKLPALVFLHGGSFVMGSHGSFDGALFVEKSAQPLMVITVQYRLGVLGSLPGNFMAEQGLLNLGIRDQRLALEFIQKYITNFGGDSAKVTLGGQSAGGHSVGIHLFHNYGDDSAQPLFRQAILSSGSPTARSFPEVSYGLYERQVDHFMDYINCPTSPAPAALTCLRAAEVDDIQFMSTSLYNAHNYNITWPWQPVSPGPLLEKRGSQSGKDGTMFKLPILISSTTDEGKAFAPQDLRFDTEFVQFWKTLSPGLTQQDLADLEILYPEIGFNGTQSMGYISSQFERISAAYGDYSYICPVQDTASVLATAKIPVFKARFNTPNWAPTYMGVPHASDAAYFNGQYGTQYPEIAEAYSAYWASFVVSGDPNTYRTAGSAMWESYDGTGGRQLVVNRPSEGGPIMEDEASGIRMIQCAWWRDPERMKRLNK